MIYFVKDELVYPISSAKAGFTKEEVFIDICTVMVNMLAYDRYMEIECLDSAWFEQLYYFTEDRGPLPLRQASVEDIDLLRQEWSIKFVTDLEEVEPLTTVVFLDQSTVEFNNKELTYGYFNRK